MFLDHTYFQGELYLPRLASNADSVGAGAKAMTRTRQDEIGWYMAKYEPEFMKKLLGRKLYKNLIDNYESDIDGGIWKTLYGNIFRKETGYSFSPCANYVYVFISQRNATQSTQKGEKRATATDAVDVSNSELIIRAWSEMNNMVREFYRFLFENWEKYEDYADSPFCPHDFGITWYF